MPTLRRFSGTGVPRRSLNRRGQASLTLSLLLFILAPALGAQTDEHQLRGCGPMAVTHQVLNHGIQLVHGIEHAPRAAIRPENLAWELPIGAATGVLIAEADQPAANRVQSPSFQRLSSHWSDAGLLIEIGASAATWGAGCLSRKPGVRDAGMAALSAIGAAGTIDLELKLSFDREFPS